MTATCPHCGCALGGPTAHRGELERQLGDPARAHALREAARAAEARTGSAVRLDGGFIAWRGYVWGPCRIRKQAVCVLTRDTLRPGAAAYRNLSEVRDRDLRVSADWWDRVMPAAPPP